MQKINYIIIAILTLLTSNLVAQVYPINVTTTLTPPYPITLKDFSAASNTSFRSTIISNDPQRPTFDVRLKIRIESNDIKIETKSSYQPISPITLTAGIPYLMQGTDFQSYLDSKNVDVSGADPNTFYQNGGRLPEGFYQICITVLDYRTGIEISLPGCAMVNIFQEQPPRLMKPECEKMVTPLMPQSVLFGWQASPGGSPTLAANSKYRLSVWKILDNDADGYAAVQNGQSLRVFESFLLSQTTFNMDLTTTQLDIGHRYAYQVKATDGQDRNVYANDGKSEFCWFYYGYPTGGLITLKSPAKGGTIGKNDEKTFEWTATDKKVQGQEFSYSIKIVKITQGQTPEQAMKNNAPWKEAKLGSTRSTQGATWELNKILETDVEYAWQVFANTGQQEVAASEVWKFYGPPFIEEFNAGNFTVIVKKTYNKNLKSLKGRGLVQLSERKTDTASCEFDNISLKVVSGQNFLDRGEVYFSLLDRTPITLSPVEKDNGPAKFIFNKGKLDKYGLFYGGVIEWPLPHPVTGDSAAVLRTDLNYYQIDKDFNIAGTATISGKNEFELADPFKHKLIIKSPADIVVGGNKYKLRLAGEFILPKSIKTNDKKPYILPFTVAGNLFEIKVIYLMSNAKNHFTPIENSSLAIKPYDAIIDLSEKKSPGSKASDVGWKGVYFPKFKAVFTKDMDNTKQIKLQYDQDSIIEQTGDVKFYTTSEGLFLNYSFEIKDDQLSFNTFPATVSGNITVEKNNLKKSKLNGKFKIPFLSQNELFSFKIPLTNEGIMQGYLDQKLADRTLAFNPYGGDNKMTIKVNRAVFANNERLDLNINVKHGSINADFKSLNDFRIYGDGYIGFEKRNGSKALSNSKAGSYSGFSFIINEIMASYESGFYHVAFLSDVDFGKRLTGKNGSPTIAFSSVMALDADSKFEDNQGIKKPIVPYQKGMENQKKVAASSYIEIKNPMNEFKGWIKIVNDDPVLGTVFAGDIEGKLLLPVQIPMKANIIIGDNAGSKYWYFDSYFVDKEGVGVPIMSPFNCVGFEGRMYHHMSLKGDAFVFDKSIDLAQTSYMQIIDGKTGGGIFQSDWVAEMKITGKDYKMTINGDISCINANRRSGAASSIAAMGGSALVSAVAKIIDVDVKIPLNSSDELGIKIKSGTNKFWYENKSENVYAGLAKKSKSGVPGAEIDLKKGSYTLKGSGYSNGLFEMKLSDKTNTLNFGAKTTTSAFVNGTIKGLAFKSDFAFDTKLMESELVFDSKKLKFTADGKLKVLRGDFTYETGKSLYGMYKNKKGFAGFTYGNLKYDMEVDPSTKIGKMKMDIDGSIVGATFWANENKGQVTFKNSSIDFIGSSNKDMVGEGHLTYNSKKVDVTFDRSKLSGTVDYAHDASKKFHGELKEGKYAYLEMDVDGNKFGIGGNAGADSGRVIFQNSDMKLNISAKPKEKTGQLNYTYKTEYEIKSAVQSDSAYAIFTGKGYTVNVSGYGKGFGRLGLKKDAFEVDLIGNQAQKYGSLFLTDGKTTITAAGCKSGISKAAAAKYDGVQGEFGSFSYKDGSYDFGGYLVPKDTVRGALFINGSGISAAANKMGKYIIQLKDPGVAFDVTGKLKERKLHFNYVTSTIKFESDADFSSEIGFFTLIDGTNNFNFNASSSASTLKIKGTSLLAKASGDSDDYKMSVERGGNAIELNADADDLTTDFKLTNGTIIYEMDGDGDLKITDGSDVITIEETLLKGLEIAKNGNTQSGSKATIKTSSGKVKASISGNEKTLEFIGSNNAKLTSNGKIGSITSTLNGVTWSASNSSTKVKLAAGDVAYVLENKVLKITTASDKNIEINPAGGKINYGTITSTIDVDKRMDFTETSNKYVAWMDESKGVAIQKQDKKVIVDLSDKILLQYDPNKYLKIENAILDLKVDKVTLFINPIEKLVYDDTKRHFEIGPQKFELTSGVMGVGISGLDFNLNIDASNFVNLGPTKLDFKVNGIGAEFSVQNPLKFENKLFKFDLGTTGLGLKYDGISIGLEDINGVPNLNLKNPIGDISINAKGFSMGIGSDLKFGMNATNYLDFEAFGRIAQFKLDGAKILDSALNVQFEFGGNYLGALKIKDYTIGIPKLGGVALKFPSAKIDLKLSSDFALALNLDGLSLDFYKNGIPFDINIGKLGFSIPSVPDGFGANINLGGFKAGLTSIESKMTQFELGNSVLGTIKFGSDADANAVVGYSDGNCSFELKVGSDGLSGEKSGSCTKYKLPPVFFATSGPPPKNSKAGSIPASSKPKYLTSKISDGAKGLSKGSLTFNVDAKKSKICGTAGWNSTTIICTKGTMYFESDGKKKTWFLEVGNHKNLVDIKPGCSDGFKGKGYFTIDNDGAYTYVKKEVNFNLKTGIGDKTVGANLSTTFKYSLAFGAGVKLDPLGLGELLMEVDIKGKVTAKWWATGADGSINIADVDLSGKLKMTPPSGNNSLSIKGDLKGKVTVLDIITASFKYGVSEKF